MDERIFQTLMAANLSALNAAIQAWRVLAVQGLLPPQDLDQMAHGLSIPFEGLEGNEIARQIHGMIEATLSPALAEVYRVAQATYKAPGGPG